MMDFNTATKVSEIMSYVSRLDRRRAYLDEQDANNSRSIAGCIMSDDDYPTAESARRIREIFRNEIAGNREAAMRQLRTLGVEVSETGSLETANIA